MKPPAPFKSGYASLIGKPNVGKSTLINELVLTKIAAMSRKPQTTRNKITGVVHIPGGQIILVDTPGIHESTSKLNQFMVRASLSTYNDMDLILFVIDANQGFCPEDQFVLKSLQEAKTPKILILNKIDLVPKPELLTLMDAMNAKKIFSELIPVSALKKDGLDVLKNVILQRLPEGPQYFPSDMVTDCPEEFLLAEIIREKIMNMTHFEIPYSAAVLIDQTEERDNGMLVITATIFVERSSQKKILIGEKGAMLKQIGRQARVEIEKRFGVRVYLSLFIKVKSGWSEQNRSIKELCDFNVSYKDR